jgi:hypothetical protein
MRGARRGAKRSEEGREEEGREEERGKEERGRGEKGTGGTRRERREEEGGKKREGEGRRGRRERREGGGNHTKQSYIRRHSLMDQPKSLHLALQLLSEYLHLLGVKDSLSYHQREDLEVDGGGMELLVFGSDG